MEVSDPHDVILNHSHTSFSSLLAGLLLDLGLVDLVRAWFEMSSEGDAFDHNLSLSLDILLWSVTKSSEVTNYTKRSNTFEILAEKLINWSRKSNTSQLTSNASNDNAKIAVTILKILYFASVEIASDEKDEIVTKLFESYKKLFESSDKEVKLRAHMCYLVYLRWGDLQGEQFLIEAALEVINELPAMLEARKSALSDELDMIVKALSRLAVDYQSDVSLSLRSPSWKLVKKYSQKNQSTTIP